MWGFNDHIKTGLAVLFGGAQFIVDVILHIGAHRTGTTTLQTYLQKNSNKLRKSRIEFWGPKRTRSGLFSGLVKPPADLSNDALLRGQRSCGLIQMEMDRLAMNGVQTLIVSEENMIGVMKDNLRKSRLYPDAGPRIARFAPAFELRCRRVVLSIRSYDKYWASVLAFCVERGWKMPDMAVLDRLVIQPNRWRDVIKSVAASFPEAQILVLPFERLMGQPDRQFAVLRGNVEIQPLYTHQEWHNASAQSEKLRQILMDRGDHRAAQTLPEKNRRWQPFNDDHINAFQQQYRQDLDWLTDGADGIATLYNETHETGTLTGTLAGQTGITPQAANVVRGQNHDTKERNMG